MSKVVDVERMSQTTQRAPSPVFKFEHAPESSAAEREARGKIARRSVPRADQARFEPEPSRPDPVALLEEQAASRVPELVPIRYGRMLTSPFAFFRGAASVMASDLAGTPRSGFTVQACGDAHLSNFGVFASPERRLVLDVNDFDETLPGPWEWDVKRLAASVEIASRERNFSKRERRQAVLEVSSSYRQRMSEFAGMRTLDVWYSHLEVEKVLADFRAQLSRVGRSRTDVEIAKAQTRDSMRSFSKLTTIANGHRRIASDPPLLVPVDELLSSDEAQALYDRMDQLLTGYRRSIQTDRRHLSQEFRFVDLARKVVGVGSVGTRAWIALLLGRDDGDALFLQAKEAQSSVLERFVGKSEYKNCGERVVAGQRLMQASSDIFLGWYRTEGIDGVNRDFYVRQLADWKGSVNPEVMVPSGMSAWAMVCGWSLARAHARSGDRIGIASYLGKSDEFDQAIAQFAAAYADQNERDYRELERAVRTGRVTALTGV